MTGLRARQKADRTRRILESAARLFREAGYDAVRIEDIAFDADLSPGTLYNYFETKGDLLLAIVSMEVEEVLAGGAAILAGPLDSTEEMLAELVNGYYDHSLVYLSKEMWRTAMALSIGSPETPVSQRYTELDRRLSAQVCALISRLQSEGLIRPDADARALGEVLFNNLNLMFFEFAKDERMSLDTLKATVSRQNAAVLRLLRIPPGR